MTTERAYSIVKQPGHVRSRANVTHRPVVLSGSRARRSSHPFSLERDVRNAGRFTAPAARRAVETQSTYIASCAFNAQRHRASACSERAHGKAAGEGSRPQKQDNACVPHADGFDRSAACPQELSLLSTHRLVRADCRPDTHLNRPLVSCRRLIALRPLSPGRSIRNLRALGPGIRSGHRIRSCAMKTVMTRPSPGRMRGSYQR